MKFVLTDPLMEFDLNYMVPNVIIIENRKLFSCFVRDLWNQCKGSSGRFILSEEEKELSLDKKADFIFNIFDISSNEKRILNKIYTELDEISKEECQSEIVEINSEIVSFLDLISQKLPYELSFELELDVIGLIKLYNMRIDEDSEDSLDRLVSYIRLSHQVRGTEFFIFLNLRQYFSYEEIEMLYEACIYEQVCIIDVEGNDSGVRLLNEKCVIIDEDLCVIDL